MKTKVILVGHGASGKDHLANYLKNNGFTKNVSHTTRPPREGEVNGDTYYFTDINDFECKIKDGYWQEYEMFVPEKKWYYGTSKEEYTRSNLLIKTVGGVAQLTQEQRDECLILFINVDERVRYERMIARRGMDDDAMRRIEADRIDFKNYTDFDLEISEPNFNCSFVMNLINFLMVI